MMEHRLLLSARAASVCKLSLVLHTKQTGRPTEDKPPHTGRVCPIEGVYFK